MPDLLGRITSEPDRFGGRPCIRGLRIRVVDVLDLLAARHQGGSRLRFQTRGPPPDRGRVTIWLDNHLPPALARWIADEFAEPCVQVRGLGLARASDNAVFMAARSSATAFITKDRDFAELWSG